MYLGGGASGKVDASVIPADHFTLSVMFVPPGQGNALHTHEVEELFFVLAAKVAMFLRLEPAYLQVMLGKAQPGLKLQGPRSPAAPWRAPHRAEVLMACRRRASGQAECLVS